MRSSLVLAAGAVGCVLASYALALAGEPQSYWLWHSVLRAF